MQDSFSTEQVLNAYNEAPDTVRAVFNADSTTQVVIDLKAKYQLHIDQAGTLGKELGYMLLGLTNPGQFVERLRAKSFSEDVIQDILKELNQKVFIPLRNQERKQTTPASSIQPPRSSFQPPAAVPPQNYVPPKSNPPSPQTVNQTQSGQSSRPPFVQPTVSRPSVASLPPKTAMPQPTVSIPPRPSILVPSSSMSETSPVQKTDRLQNIMQPQQTIRQTLPGAIPTTQVPTQIPVTPPQPSPSLAGAISQAVSKPTPPMATPAPVQAPKPMPPPLPVPQSPRLNSAPSTSRSSDPYREPIE